MSTEEVGLKSTDDNIITRRKHVKQQLSVIRDKKERLHAAMKTVSSAEQPDKALMKQLLEAFDTMTEQEGKYVEVMKDILKVHELAVEDVAKEIEEKKKTAPAEKEKVKEGKKEENFVVSEQTEEQKKEDLSELEACLRELQEVSAAAAAASQLNEQLVERLQLQKNKKTTLNEIRKEKTSTMRKTANETLTEVEIAKLKVHTEKTAKDRKEKQLERLRKEALKRGIQQETLEDKEKEEMIAAAEASTDRIPGVQTEDDQKEEEEPKTDEERMEERRKEIRENVRKEREKKEQINQQIRERLRAMEARKERVRQLRLSLQQAAETPGSEEEARQALDDMFSNAAANLANLTAMRERLEAMQLNQEEDEESSPTGELEEEVRHRFTNVMQATVTPQYDSQQLTRIESLLLLQSEKMNELTRSLQPSVVRFRQSLLTSSPSSLRGLSDCLLLLAAGQSAPQLDHHLKTVLNETRADEEPTTKVDIRQGYARNGVSLEEKREPQAEEVSRQLMSTIRELLEEVETIETETAKRLRQVTCHLVGQLLPSVSEEVCDTQLGTQVFDSVRQYLGILVADCLENILYDLEELFRNEISYFALMNNLRTIPDKQ